MEDYLSYVNSVVLDASQWRSLKDKLRSYTYGFDNSQKLIKELLKLLDDITASTNDTTILNKVAKVKKQVHVNKINNADKYSI